jgi:hypothetical protein
MGQTGLPFARLDKRGNWSVVLRVMSQSKERGTNGEAITPIITWLRGGGDQDENGSGAGGPGSDSVP